jgi:hypothetical protein
MKQGELPGLLCLVSSRRYPGQFTDKKEEEARAQLAEFGKTNIYIYDVRPWEVKPEGTYGPERFKVFIGDVSRKPCVIDAETEHLLLEENLVIDVPIEHLQEFRDDILNALRDIAGVSTLATSPYMTDTLAVGACFGRFKSVLSGHITDFHTTTVLLYPKRILNPKSPRFVHLDLSLTGDSTGVVIGHVTGFKDVNRGDVVERLPIIALDCTLEVKPPSNGEVNFSKIRGLLYRLVDLGMPIKWVTCDSFQSADTMQILRQRGFIVGYQSLDTTLVPYTFLKRAIYDGRLVADEHPRLQRELVSLEYLAKKDKVDHPKNGSKDVADAVAGVVYGLTMRREVWSLFKVPVTESINQLIKAHPNTDKQTSHTALNV